MLAQRYALIVVHAAIGLEYNRLLLWSAFSALMLLVGRQEWHPACKWWGAGVVICLELGADLHMAQLMPLPLTVSCSSKIQIGFTFLVPAHPGSPRKRQLNGCVCVLWCVCVCVNTETAGRPAAATRRCQHARPDPRGACRTLTDCRVYSACETATCSVSVESVSGHAEPRPGRSS